MSAGRAELTNVGAAGVGAARALPSMILVGICDECAAELRFWINVGAEQPAVYEEASIVLRCSCGAQSQYTVTP